MSMTSTVSDQQMGSSSADDHELMLYYDLTSANHAVCVTVAAAIQSVQDIMSLYGLPQATLAFRSIQAISIPERHILIDRPLQLPDQA